MSDDSGFSDGADLGEGVYGGGGGGAGGGLIRGTIGGLIGGIVGAAVWAAITYFANAEIGWIAWGIGLVTGLGVRALAGDETGAALGVIASVIAVVSICAGKYAAIEMLMAAEMDGGAGPVITAEDMIVGFADEVVQEREEAGAPVQWPAGMSYEEADEEADYPSDIWAEGKERWDSLGAEEQEDRIAQQEAQWNEFMEMFESELKQAAFKESFGVLDIVFFLLAVVTAFKVGSGLGAD